MALSPLEAAAVMSAPAARRVSVAEIRWAGAQVVTTLSEAV